MVALDHRGDGWCAVCRWEIGGPLDSIDSTPARRGRRPMLTSRILDALAEENLGTDRIRELVLARRIGGYEAVLSLVDVNREMVYPPQGAAWCKCHGPWMALPYDGQWLNLVAWWCVFEERPHKHRVHHVVDEPVYRLSPKRWGPAGEDTTAPPRSSPSRRHLPI